MEASDEALLAEAARIQTSRGIFVGSEQAHAEDGAGASQEAVIDLIVSREDLSIALRQSRALFAEISASSKSAGDPELQDDVIRCIKFFDVCAQGIRRLGVFSDNENVKEMATEDLLCLLADYYLGKLELKVMGSGDSTGVARHEAVKGGRTLLESFLQRCKLYGLLDDLDEKYLERLQQGLNEQDEDEEKSKLHVVPRQIKTERFKRAKAAKEKIHELEKRLSSLDEDDASKLELERERILTTIDCAIKDAFDEIDSALREEEILQHMVKMNLRFSDPNEQRMKPPRPKGTMTVTRIDKNLQMIRETIREQIFRPSWRQPTMSIEEYAEIEMQRALDKEKREAELRKENPEVMSLDALHEQGLEDDEDKMDQAIVKARNWDDWKDENPKGRGNTKRF